MVWVWSGGKRALAGLFPDNFDHWDITKKEMVNIMAAVKHWISDLANLRVQIFVDNQACVALLNHGVTRCPILAACLREMYFFLAKYNIELKAHYIPSKGNCLADLCSRAFSSVSHHTNFTKLLVDRVLILDLLDYRKLEFELDL